MLIYDPVCDENLLSGQPQISNNWRFPEGGRLMEVQLYRKCIKTSTKTEAIFYIIQLLSTNCG